MKNSVAIIGTLPFSINPIISSAIISEENENSFYDQTTENKWLAASLSSFTNTAIRMYTDHKKWDIQEINIDIDLERDEAENILTITQTITLLGNLDENQRNRLVAVVNNCPIQETLLNTININTIIS